MSYENIIAEKKGNVGLITLNRPQALNALCAALITDIGAALDDFESDENIRAIVITGSERAFAAGADIKEMADYDYMDVYKNDFITKGWTRVTSCRKPTIAAVAGFALGGGCELAMMCDIMIAADTAKFGQPEVSIGVIPGAGGTQRLARSVGRAMAMDMCLTGRMLDANEALRIGLVSRVLPTEGFAEAMVAIGGEIAKQAPLAVRLAKEAVEAAYETPLEGGIMAERNLFFSCFGTEDQKEGMQAFLEKRKPEWRNR